MGRHSVPCPTPRALALGALGALTLSSLITGAASAQPGTSCVDGTQTRNPAVAVCQDSPLYDQSDAVHALIKANPVLCTHLVIDPRGDRRLVSTRGCGPRTPPVTGPAPCPNQVTAPQPCPCPPQQGTVVVTPPAEQAPPTGQPAPVVVTPTQQAPLEEAPAPTIINNNTTGTPLPVVTG